VRWPTIWLLIMARPPRWDGAHGPRFPSSQADTSPGGAVEITRHPEGGRERLRGPYPHTAQRARSPERPAIASAVRATGGRRCAAGGRWPLSASLRPVITGTRNPPRRAGRPEGPTPEVFASSAIPQSSETFFGTVMLVLRLFALMAPTGILPFEGHHPLGQRRQSAPLASRFFGVSASQTRAPVAAARWSKARNTGLPGVTRPPPALVLGTPRLPPRRGACRPRSNDAAGIWRRPRHHVVDGPLPFPALRASSTDCGTWFIHRSLPALHSFTLGEVFHRYWHRGPNYDTLL